MSLPDRVELIRQSNDVTGLDFVRVSDDQRELFVFLHHLQLPAGLATSLAGIEPENIHIKALSDIVPGEVIVVQHVTPVPTFDNRPALHLRVNQPGGFGYYRLSIDHTAVDPYFNDLEFTFKAGCESPFDCKEEPGQCPPEASVDFPVDYRARDFSSFRRVLTDFAAERYPDWQDRLEADLGMMLTELMSALGDEFSYAQDRIQRETGFADASQRRSLRHFARLMDYEIDNGSGANTWVDVTVNANGSLPAGTRITDVFAQQVFELGQGLIDLGKDFAVSVNRNEFVPYIWDENDTCVFRGSRRLTLSGHHAGQFLADSDIDAVGKWVLLATRPTEPDIPERRVIVRVIDASEDTDPVTGGPVTYIDWDEPLAHDLDLTTLIVRGNLVPATSGETMPAVSEAPLRFRIGPAPDPLDPDADLPRAIERVGANTSFSSRQDDGAVKFLFSLPQSDEKDLVWLGSDNARRPEVLVQREPNEDWNWLPAMIGEAVAGPTQPVFTLEDGVYRTVFSVERFGERMHFEDYAASQGFTIRFGDGEFGLAPREGDIFAVRYRLGSGRLSNVSANTLVRFKTEFDDPPVRPGFVDAITNPLAATDGRDPESAEQIKINVPEAYKAVTHRAVKAEDYASIGERLPWVQKAGAHFRWTGSWPTVFVTPDPLEETGVPEALRDEFSTLMDRVRQAGRETCVKDPIYANLDLEIRVCVSANAYPAQVQERVLVALFGGGETRGFFDPDNFTFGTPLRRAALVAAIQDIDGVHAVNGLRIRRRGWFDWRDFSEFCYRAGINELIHVTNNPLLPEQGAVRLIMEGGA